MAHGRANEIQDEIGNPRVLPPLANELVAMALTSVRASRVLSVLSAPGVSLAASVASGLR